MNEFHKAIKLLGKTFIDFSGTLSDTDSGKSLERQIVKRDKKYTDLLDNYLSITKIRNNVKEWHKWIFFWLIIASCGLVIYLVYKTLFLYLGI